MRRPALILIAAAVLATASIAATSSSALACAGLIGSRGQVNLGRTTTLAAYHDGIEHYVTAFKFLGGGGQFGTLIPLPGMPSKVERGGAWTLQRLVRETEPPIAFAAESRSAAGAAAKADVVLTAKVDALDLTVLRGGGPSVADWAHEHGFSLSPDAPEVLEFYANQSPYFLAAVFDGAAAAARGQQVGDGTPVHITIPTGNPWVPLRILGLGKKASDTVEADVYLLTDSLPKLSPGLRKGLTLQVSNAASKSLLDDLRSDAGMGWVPSSAWLTKVAINGRVSDVRYDLAVDAGGKKVAPIAATVAAGDDGWWPVVAVAAGAAVLAVVLFGARRAVRGA